MTEKELEKLFKSKLDNREFAFNPANWEAMEAMLDADPKPAGAFYWRSVAAVLLFAVGVWSLITFTDRAPQQNVADQPAQKVEEPAKADVNNIVSETKSQNSKQAADEVNSAVVDQPLVAGQEEMNTESNVSSAISTFANQQGEENLENTLAEVGSVDPTDLISLDIKQVSYQYNLTASQGEARSSNVSVVNWSSDGLKKYQQKKTFYLEVAPVFTGSQNANNVGFGWEVGIGYQHEFANKLVVNAGVNYLVQNGVDISNKSDSVFYNFGKEVVQTEEINKRLDYIEVPISVGYKLNEKHSLHVGAYASFLVNVSQEVNKETSGYKTETKTETIENSGYQEGFNRWDAGLNFGYRYTLTPDLSVGLHYSLGLKDITDDDAGGEYQQAHTNQSTRVIFRYSLF